MQSESQVPDIRSTFLTRLVATPAGREHLLSISVEAEEGDESGIFDQLADAVDDPKLRRIVEVHRDDEVRHAGLFRGCLDRLGLECRPIPDELKIIRQIGVATGGLDHLVRPRLSGEERAGGAAPERVVRPRLSGEERAGGAAPERLVRTVDDIVATYAMLLVIEERGVEQFPAIAEAFATVDQETADVYRRVARDERGHVRYCETIGRHYSADESAWQQLVAQARGIEEQAFLAVGLANIAYCVARGWVDADALLVP